MTIEEQIEFWFNSADEDLIVAESLYEKKHFTWCLFLGHLIIEKALKGHYVKKNMIIPPKTHDLIKLIKKTTISYDEDLLEFLADLNDFQINARYPVHKKAVFQVATNEFSEKYFSKLKELYKWLKSQI